MRFNKAAAGALLAGASLVHAQDEYCSDRSTIVVTEYVTLPGPVSSTPTPASSTVDGAASSSAPVEETTSVQVVTLTPVPATSSPPMTTSTLYSTTSTIDAEGSTVYLTAFSTTTVCPVSETSVAGTPDDDVTTTIHSTSSTTEFRTITQCAECTTPQPTQWTTSTIYTTSASVDENDNTVYVTVPHTTTVCPVTATEVPSSSKCTNTRTVTVDPPAVTVTVQPTQSAAVDGAVGAAAYTPSSSVDAAVGAAEYTPSSSSSVSVAVDTPVYTPVASSSASVAVDSPVYTPAPVAASTPAAADAGVDGAAGVPSSSSVSVAVDTPVYTPVPVASTPSVAVDTPSYTPAPASSTPAVFVESASSSTPVYTPSSSTSSAPAATSSDSSLVGTVGGTVTSLTEAVTGEATYYTGDVSSGTCSFTGYTLPSSIFGTALSDSNWATAGNCGACVSVKGPSGDAITAMIVDKCPGCGDNHLDLFEDAFSSLAATATGVIDVAWEIVECGITTPLKLTNKDGASEYWFSMQVVNSNLPVKGLSVSTDGGSTWTETTRTDYNFFEYEQGFSTSTVDIKVTSTTGKEVITKNVTIGSGSSHECDSNF
ncbi:hypothetical protein SLS57_010903 [Botryosphaeria dothidea]